MRSSWRTTLAGLGLALSAIGSALTGQFDEDESTQANWPLAVTLTLAAAGLMAARDNSVSSEKAGAAR